MQEEINLEIDDNETQDSQYGKPLGELEDSERRRALRKRAAEIERNLQNF